MDANVVGGGLTRVHYLKIFNTFSLKTVNCGSARAYWQDRTWGKRQYLDYLQVVLGVFAAQSAHL